MKKLATCGALLIGLAACKPGPETNFQLHMISECEAAKPDCVDLIHIVQADGHHEVLSKDGVYWVETKG